MSLTIEHLYDDLWVYGQKAIYDPLAGLGLSPAVGAKTTFKGEITGDEDIQLINAKPTYLEGRRGIELAYQDSAGHTVTYIIVPGGSVILITASRASVGANPEAWIAATLAGMA